MSDELKPVRCGCGGEAEIFHIAPEGYEGSYCVRCMECLTQTPFFNKDKDKAIEAWNRAMGERTVNVASVDKPIEGSDITIHVTYCEKCETVVGIFDNYCPGCGARLDWEKTK